MIGGSEQLLYFTIMCANIHKTEPTVDGNDDERESHYSDCM